MGLRRLSERPTAPRFSHGPTALPKFKFKCPGHRPSFGVLDSALHLQIVHLVCAVTVDPHELLQCEQSLVQILMMISFHVACDIERQIHVIV